MSVDLTLHAQGRLQQRAIPPFIIALLDEFGSIARCGGAERLTFDKAARRRLAREFGGQRNLHVIERWLGVYVVVSDDGLVVTAAHRTRRFRRH
ncbi:hypothetical protein [Methylobacterium brachythecii]|uniref:DUF4258 domain-containing protein n=1 Tax=Methylobacterium brachythecii TaxID=1176177 RepID=A0A7W6F9M0_9HYPH|nr:hypothetical protein [Methylobacterium brachythecii]MBB3905662.1 hypothetical protein [Methylobacterium brachythecii]GLS46939.1 hypothetical protein GCM10007884_49390 [Methylobacterium brachythecii]